MSATKELYEQDEKTFEVVDVQSVEKAVYNDKWTRRLLRIGVEDRGVQPVPVEQRTDTQYHKLFFIFFTWNINILTLAAGSLGPVAFGLGLRDTCLAILFFNIFCCAFPAYFVTWGPKLGMRQMIVSRYSFGYYGVIVPCIFNLISMVGYSILSAIVGGQALASLAPNLSWSIGIVIISVISLLVSFCGYNALNWYERIAWVPLIITFVIVAGVGGHHLSSPPPAEPATASSVLSFASTLAGFSITFAGLSSDYSTYYRSDVSAWRIFWYSYIGLLVPFVTLQCLGAAVVVAAPGVPEWELGYRGGNVGGLLEAMLHPTKGFGKFLTVLLCLSVVGNIAGCCYSISINLQVFIPWLVVVPRYVFSIIAIAIIIPLSIVGSHRFYDALANFQGLIGYWASAYVAILLIEHLYFRRNETSNYEEKAWNVPSLLPTGIAALGASICSIGLIVPSMNQVWFIGPIGKVTGDIGFEVAFAVSGVLYFPFRYLEIRWMGRF